MTQNNSRWNQQSSNLYTEQRLLPQHWNPQTKNSFKINIDGSFLEHATEGAVAGILRDAIGTLLDGFTGIVPATSSLHTELQALLQALQAFVAWRNEHIVLETDSLLIVKMLNEQGQVGWEDEAAVHEAQIRLAHYSKITVAHCNRTANQAADWIAKAQRQKSLFSSWLMRLPQPLWELLCFDAPLSGCRSKNS
ncbi:uncharacterized protein LOC115678494 [Syzygium oleosum]|uniref:uncharacterized protein LOC115678494 n=1 Tax=Syzygium oleosum TaxID=219896 RepID=UPI0011D29C33|nr:uncharacterized protein LOC115678494 [Syzygium oleosum]